MITSDEWFLTTAVFQVYALEGVGKGIVDGKFSVEPTSKILFDRDVEGLDNAVKLFQDSITDAEKQGFKQLTIVDELKFQSHLRH